jgi:hypothetical protein
VAVLLAVLSSLTWGTADFLGGLLSRRRAAAAVVAGSQACGLAAVAAFAVATSAWRAPDGWLPWAIAAGLAGTVGLVSFYAALGSGTMGVVSSIAALGALIQWSSGSQWATGPQRSPSPAWGSRCSAP